MSRSLLDLLYFDPKKKRKANEALEALWQQSEVPGQQLAMPVSNTANDYDAAPMYDLGRAPSTYGENQAAVDRSKAMRMHDPELAYAQYLKETGADHDYTLKGQEVDEGKRKAGLIDRLRGLIDGGAGVSEMGQQQINNMLMLLDPSNYMSNKTARDARNNVAQIVEVMNPDGTVSYKKVFRDGREEAMQGTAPGNYQIDSSGPGVKRFNPHTGNWEEIQTPEDRGAGAGRQEEAEQDVLRRYKARQAQAKSTKENTLELVQKAINHKGFDGAYGLSAYIPTIYGTPRAGFEAIRKQITSEAFLSNVDRMQGMGTLTDKEGDAIRTAITRIGESSMSDAEAMEAFKEIERYFISAIEKEQMMIDADFTSSARIIK